jgi:uncharacterized peroxidase-related enzyme
MEATMRLKKIENGQPVRLRLLLTVIGMTSGHVPDVLRAVMYRPEFFGRPFSALVHQALRGPSDWSVYERELFAMFVSHLNECPFCDYSHGAAASRGMQDAVISAVRSDWHAAPVSEQVRAALGFLEQLTVTPEPVSPAAVAPLRAAGIRDAAIEDLVVICALFTMINRIANALDFQPPDPKEAQQEASSMLSRGYKF